MGVEQEEQWTKYLLPLPHEIIVEGEITCHPGAVLLRARQGAGAVEQQALAELHQLLSDRDDSTATDAEFEIVLGTVDANGQLEGESVDVERLQELPNKEQAYIIQPRGDKGLVLAALGERGVYYAARTLYQLLESNMAPDKITIPLARVVDWPDIDERGLWNFPNGAEWIRWLASVKLNYGKMANTALAPIERDKPNSAVIDVDLMEEARQQAFNYVPYILHLNFLHDCGLFKAYPQLAGKGDGALTGRYFAHKHGNQHRAPCASQPKLTEIITEWMHSIASQGGNDISCWLSERPGQCGCTDCTAVGQFVLESRAFVAAWRQVQQHYPDLQIRMFLSTTTAERDYRVVAELPEEVKIERACATTMEQVLHWPRDLAANPLLDYYAAAGRWIATYDVPIGAYGKVDTPEFKVPERSAHRIKDYVGQLVRRRYSGAYGMLAWGTLAKEINGFNIEALAEWSWNLNGRTEEEFAVAWALRQGYADPEKVGRWAELMGPVEFDVYDSDFPVCYSWGKAVDMVRNKQRPYLGEGMFRYYLDGEDFARKRAVCATALQLVEELPEVDLANETRVVDSYIELARCLYLIAEQVATADLGVPENQVVLQEALAELEHAGATNVAMIEQWRGNLGPQPWHYRVQDAIVATRTTVEEIARFIRECHIY